MNDTLQWLTPDWPAPAGIRAISTTRLGGVSEHPYKALNLGDHVGDETRKVANNRAILRAKLVLPSQPHWLKQVHSSKIIQVSNNSLPSIEADGSFTQQTSQICVVLSADCLPILFSDRAGTTVAAIHAGWRGLANGIIETTLQAMGLANDSLLAWLGPAIGPEKFEVGADVKAIFAAKAYNTIPAFKSLSADKWLLDIYQLARVNLAYFGVTHIYGGDQCTYSQSNRYFSYRRDGITGRMASLIWIDADQTNTKII